MSKSPWRWFNKNANVLPSWPLDADRSAVGAWQVSDRCGGREGSDLTSPMTPTESSVTQRGLIDATHRKSNTARRSLVQRSASSTQTLQELITIMNQTHVLINWSMKQYMVTMNLCCTHPICWRNYSRDRWSCTHLLPPCKRFEELDNDIFSRHKSPHALKRQKSTYVECMLMKLPSACYKRLVVFAPTPGSLREEILHTYIWKSRLCVCVCVICCRTWVGAGRWLHAGHRLQQRVAGAGHHVLTLFMTALTPRISRPLSSLTPCNHYSTTHRRCGATPEQFLVSLPRETGS